MTNKTVAAVDIGTNSVKMTVATQNTDGTLSVLLEDTIITRLGKGVDESGRITGDAAMRTFDALQGFGDKARSLGATTIAAVGTSALRDATNGAAIVAEAQTRLGGTLEIISGKREAELTFRAADGDGQIAALLPPNPLLVTCDIGGGSTEIVQGIGGEIFYAESLQIGAVRLSERAGLADPVTAEAFQNAALEAQAALANIPTPSPALEPVLVASGGTAANLAAMEVALTGSPITFDALHAYRLTREQIEDRTVFLASLPLSARRKIPGLEPDRADVIVAGAILQGRVMARLGVNTVIVSLRGLRYGLLYELFQIDDNKT